MLYALWDVSSSTNVESRQDVTCAVLMLSNNVFVPLGCGKIESWFALGNALVKQFLYVYAESICVLLEKSHHRLVSLFQ